MKHLEHACVPARVALGAACGRVVLEVAKGRRVHVDHLAKGIGRALPQLSKTSANRANPAKVPNQRQGAGVRGPWSAVILTMGATEKIGSIPLVDSRAGHNSRAASVPCSGTARR